MLVEIGLLADTPSENKGMGLMALGRATGIDRGERFALQNLPLLGDIGKG